MTIQKLFERIRYERYQLRYPYTPNSIKKHYIFVHIPKVAGSAIRNSLGEPLSGRRHLPLWIYKDASPKRFNRYFKFSFVRHPLTRTMSAYRYLRNGGNGTSDRVVQRTMTQFENFADFVANGLINGRFMQHVMFRPQTDYLCDWRGNIGVDFLGKFENIDADFAEVKKNLNGITPLQKVNQTPVNDLVNSSSITPTVIDHIWQLYKKDFESFDYNLESCLNPG